MPTKGCVEASEEVRERLARGEPITEQEFNFLRSRPVQVQTGPALVANSLSRGREKRTMRQSEAAIRFLIGQVQVKVAFATNGVTILDTSNKRSEELWVQHRK
jgi:hypothetical protein